jgi:hypothetical protein
MTPGTWVATPSGQIVSRGPDGNRTIANLPYGATPAERAEIAENGAVMAAGPALLAALEDMLSGWRYIRQTHGDLYGVGWDRAEDAATAAIASARP